MKKVIMFNYLLVITLFFCSCKSHVKNNAKIVSENQKTNLETYLKKDNYIKLTMEKMPSGHLHIFAHLNNVPANFILDTGAGMTVIEEKNEQKFKMLTEETEGKATGAGGTGIRLQVSKKNKLQLAELHLTEQSLMLMSLDHVNNALVSLGLEKIDGVIGADILTEKKAIIDYSNLTLYLKK